MPPGPALARLVALKRLLARLVLVSEQVLPMSAAAAFDGRALSRRLLVRPVPPCAEWASPRLLGAFVVALLLPLLAFRKLRWPSVAEADRLLEDRNGLPHQPVTVQEDEPAFETPFARHCGVNTRPAWRSGSRRSMPGCRVPISPATTASRFAPFRRFLLVVAFGFSMSNNGGSLRDAFDRSTTPSGASRICASTPG